MNQQILTKIQTKYGKQNPAVLNAGDTIKVYERIFERDKERIQVFEGLVIAVKHGIGLSGTFTVRKISANNIGVEKIFPIHSPNIIKIERIKTADVGRSKIYYMRDRFGKSAKLKHESISHAVWEETDAEKELEKIKEETTEAAEQKEETQEENGNQKIENSSEEQKS